MGVSHKQTKKKWSLRLRLSLFFSAALLLTWICAAIIIWKESETYIHEFFDTQQLLFAKRLSAASLNDLIGTPSGGKLREVEIQKKYKGNDEDDALSFAIFSHYGHELLSDGLHDEQFIFRPFFNGFENAHVKGSNELWRMVWLPSEDGRFMVVVGQELSYRHEMMLSLMKKQLLPWFILLPILLLGQLLILNRELLPIRQLNEQLMARHPNDSEPLPIKRIPSELQPVVNSLNDLFVRTEQMITRERSFISTAAHELRTPLSGLRIQADVALLSLDDPKTFEASINKLLQGIDRSSHLVEQLLTLSRMDAFSDGENNKDLQLETIHWSLLLNEVLTYYKPLAEKKGIALTLNDKILPKIQEGFTTLLSILLRNLLSNAIAYTPEQGEIYITTDRHSLCVENTCLPMEEEIISRLGERFYRIPGQKEPGSGLGIPIMKRIVEIHGFNITWGQRIDSSAEKYFFYVQIQFNQ